jgi:endothelin-converting enzyme/putative endopeptidase
MVFPAGIMQRPFFNRDFPSPMNYGGIGMGMGHELTHGFDDQGRKFDPQGNLNDWWTEEDAKEFEKRASCVADQYSGYTVPGGVNINGRLTLGENTADNGGLRIAYMALQDVSAMRSANESRRAALGASRPSGASPPDPQAPAHQAGLRDGFTPEQRLFLGWAQIWCQNETEESSKLRAQIDPHSAGRYRVIGPVSNMPEFAQAFSCPAGSKMVRENACRVW